jgi:HSP20 family protein
MRQRPFNLKIMPRKEKSFFGKIMGGDVTDVAVEEEENTAEFEDVEDAEEEEEDEGLVDEEELEDEDLDESDDGDYEDEEEEPAPVQAPIQQPAAVAPVEYEDIEPENVAVGSSSAPSSRDEEWMNDYEGALNIDMYQTKDNVIIKSTIAGVRPDDIDITVANDMVTIKGARTREEKIVQDDYFYQECYWGSFSRSVIVPVDIDSEHIEADLKDGILTVIIPKAAKAKTKKVKVKGL